MGGLKAASKRPKSSPAAKVAEKHRDWIRELRKRDLGSRRIQNELKRFYNFKISRATIDKTLRAIEAKPLLRRSRNRKHSTRYAKLIPGERVQMDTPCVSARKVPPCPSWSASYASVAPSTKRSQHLPGGPKLTATAGPDQNAKTKRQRSSPSHQRSFTMSPLRPRKQNT
jgi:hypothetical protein